MGFVAGVNKDMIFPVILGKIVAGITALFIGNILAPKLLDKISGA